MIIGLYSSVPRAGKTTVADRLWGVHGFHRMHFAEAGKRMIQSLLGDMGFSCRDIYEMLYGSEKDQHIRGFRFSARHLMITLGTDWGRTMIHPDLWVNILRGKIERLRREEPHRGIVVDDIRFPNEYDMLREIGAKMVRIVNPAAAEVAPPRCEGQLDNYEWDVTITNDAPVRLLYAQVDQLVD